MSEVRKKLTFNTINKKIVSDFLEYALVLLVMMELNTMFANDLFHNSGLKGAMTYLPLLILVGLIALNFKVEEVVNNLKSLYVQGGIYLFFILFYFVNVIKVAETSRQLYVFRYLLFFPLLVLYVQILKSEHRRFDIILKFSNVMFVVAVLSLFMYFLLIFGPDNIPSDLPGTGWGMNGKGIKYIPNIFGFAGFRIEDQFKIGSLSFIKNIGYAPEPPMFYTPLLIALYTELFIRRTNEAFVRGVVLSAVILTTGGTNGIIILAIAWGLFYVSYQKKIFNVRNIILLGVIALGTVYFVYDKSNQAYSSYAKHVEDYIVALKCFKDNFLFGCGFENMEGLGSYFSTGTATGISNSIAVNLAENGVIFGGMFIATFVFAIIKNIKKNRNNAFFWIGIFLLYSVVVFLDRYMLVVLLVIGLSLIDTTKEVIKVQEDNADITTKNRVFLIKTIVISVAWIVILVLFCNIEMLSRALHHYYGNHSLYISQSLFRLPTFALLVIANTILIRNCKKIEIINNGVINQLINILPIVINIIVYELTYNHISHSVRVFLCGVDKYTDVGWAVFILVLYLVVFVATYEIMGVIFDEMRYNVKVYITAIVMCVPLLLTTLALGIYSSKNEEEVMMTEYTEDLDELTHEATVVLNFGDRRFEENEELCTVRIVGIKDNRILANEHVTGEDIDESGTANIDIIYKNESEGVDVYYDIIPESNVGFSVYADSYYNELKELYVSTYNKYNLPIRRMYFNADGTPQIKDGGYSILESDYDSKGMTLANRYYDVNGNRIMYRGRFFEVKYERDGRGNATKESYYDIDGNPARQNGGFYQFERDYNEKDLVTSTRYLDSDGKPATIYEGYSEIRTDYNEIHKKSKEAYFDVEGNPVINRSGFSSIEYVYNVDKAVESQSYFGTDGEPILNESGYAKVTYDYNDKLDLIDEKYFDVDGNAIKSTKGYARIYKEYNDNHQVTREEFRDEDGKLVGLIKTQEYDDHYNRIAVNYIDDTGTLSMVDDQYSTIKYYYDEKNRCTNEEYYNTDGELSNLVNCAAVISYEYDDITNLKIRQSYLDSNKSPVMYNGQYYAVEYTYNDKKLVETQSYYDINSRPVMLRDKYSSFEQHYDTFNNVTDLTYYDANGKKTINTWGYCERKMEYNNDNKVITEKYYDTDGNQMNLPSGQADKHLEYDDRGNVVKEYYHDIDDKTAYIWGEYSEVLSEYDELNRLVRREYYKDNEHAVLGKGYSLYENDFDEKGNNIEVRYYDADNKLVVVSDGYAIRKNKFDDRNCLIEEAYFDANNKLVLTNWGFSIRRRIYDDAKRVVEDAFYDEAGKPLTQGDGAFIRKFKYDIMGYDWTSETFYDVNSKATCAYGSYAEIKRYYDIRRNVIKDEYYDMNENMVNIGGGQAYYIQEIDDRYNVTQISYYDADNNPVNKAGEYFLDSRMYDSDGKMTMKVLYKVDGKIFLQEEY